MAAVLLRILGPDPVGSLGVPAVITGVAVEATATTEADPAVEAGVVAIGVAVVAAAAAAAAAAVAAAAEVAVAVAVAAATVVATTDAANAREVVVVARRGQGEIAVGKGRRDEDVEDLQMMHDVYPKAAAPPKSMCRLLMRTSCSKTPLMKVHRYNEE